MTWYAKGFEGAAQLRQRLCRIESVEEGTRLLNGAIEDLSEITLAAV